ncbi:AAA family ATPase [Campylobacter coli]|nr:ATP-binding protein [Campylobacter coli]EAK1359924.1 ATP-binding protein [Campylobacter coli]EAW7552002.1 ATP-binding protein [Campylobacter coli]EGK8202672.1 ATP-binding protein [Campylobacter coli]
MKIQLKNIGMLEEAEFEVGDITLICGENNTGKTYATYSLYGYLDFMRKIGDYNIFTRRRSLFEDSKSEYIKKRIQEKKITFEEIQKRIYKHLEEKGQAYSKYILLEVMAGKNENFANAYFNVDITISLEDIKCAVEKYLENNEIHMRYKTKFKHTIYSDGLAIEMIKLENAREFNGYIKSFLDSLLNIIMNRNFILSVERTGASIFQEELDFTKIARLEAARKILKDEKNIGLFEIAETLDAKKQLYPQPVRDNINFIRKIKEIAKKQSLFKKEKEQYKTILDCLAKILGGKYKTTDVGILFQPKGTKTAYNVEIASSSVRSLLMLNYYILHQAQKGDILMIDEPELNLHPKNQILLARLFALLANAGIKIFITTHSDYIVRELSNCIMLSNLSDEAIQRLKNRCYSKECKLNNNNVKAYVAKNIKGKNTLEEVKITQKQGIFMKTFDEAIEDQNENQGLIFEEMYREQDDK